VCGGFGLMAVNIADIKPIGCISALKMSKIILKLNGCKPEYSRGIRLWEIF
jgi:hypothetical protein